MSENNIEFPSKDTPDRDRDLEEIGRVRRAVQNVLETKLPSTSEKEAVETEIRSVLDELKVPYSRIIVDRDRNRIDGKDYYSVLVYVPNRWPGKPADNKESALGFEVEDKMESEDESY